MKFIEQYISYNIYWVLSLYLIDQVMLETFTGLEAYDGQREGNNLVCSDFVFVHDHI